MILLWLAGPAARAQAPAWQAAMAVNQTFNTGSKTQAMATDASGNVFITGSFSGTTSFGSIDLMSTGGTDIFVAKWSPITHDFVWAQRAGGAGDDYPQALALSGTSLYLTGQFRSTTAGFGSISLQNAGLANTDDLFVTKLTDAGAFVWAQRAGGVSSDAVVALSVAPPNVYITGGFASPAAGFGGITLLNMGASGTYDAFVAKLVDRGNSSDFEWAQRAGGADTDVATAVAMVGTSLYVAGEFRSPTASFGAITLTNANASQPFSDDVFVTRLTDGGSGSHFDWAQRAGGIGYDDAYALTAVGPALYLTGNFGYSATASATPTATFGTTSLTSAGLSDVFVTKLTDTGSSGLFNWAQRAGSTLADTPKGIVAAGTSLYVVGSFGGPTADFGSTLLTNANPTGSNDVFVTKLTDAGTSAPFAWATLAGGEYTDDGNAIALAGNRLYVAGNLASPATFGNILINGPANLPRAFLASLTDPTLTATTAPQSPLSFTLAPNPARTAAALTLPALPGTATATVVLRDALGRTLRTQTLPLPAAGLRHPLDLTGLAPGLYAVQVLAGSTAGTQRLVVE
ncbi:hypothetical protein GCM10027044_16620 [Hymenobacter ruber]